jgi:zinc transporter
MDKYKIARVQRFIVGNGSIQEIDYRLKAELPKNGFEWLHFDRAHQDAQEWLSKQNDIDPALHAMILSEETRPCCLILDKGIFLNLRAIDFKQSDEVDDFISLRMWITPTRLVSFRKYYVPAVAEALGEMREGNVPQNVTELVSRLAYYLSAGSNADFSVIGEKQLDLNDVQKLASTRGQVMAMQQHLKPQIAAINGWVNAVAGAGTAAKAHMLAISSLETAQRLTERLATFLSKAAIYQDMSIEKREYTFRRRMQYLAGGNLAVLILILLTISL